MTKLLFSDLALMLIPVFLGLAVVVGLANLAVAIQYQDIVEAATILPYQDYLSLCEKPEYIPNYIGGPSI